MSTGNPKADAVATWPLVIGEVQARPDLVALVSDPELGALLVADMRERHEHGLREYGVALAPGLVDTLRYLYEEKLDSVVYSKTLVLEYPEGSADRDFFEAMYRHEVADCLLLRARMLDRSTSG